MTARRTNCTLGNYGESHSRPAGQVVVFWTRREATCDDCKEALPPGSLIRLEDGSANCLDCADLGHLVLLLRGDAALTRRADKHSALSAVVVRWSFARRRYERQGLLVEEGALERAEAECLSDADRREARRRRAAEAIARHACARYSGRIGRTASAKALSAEAIDLAVRAHIRHRHTRYDEHLMMGWDRGRAREAVHAIVDDVAARWLGRA